MMATLTTYRALTRDMDRSLERVAGQPEHRRATERYRAEIGSIRSVDDFMNNPRVYGYALKAHGLEDMAYAKAFIRKVLEGGIDGNDAFANKLSDPRYRALAETFNFKRYGETATVFTRAQEGTVARYGRQVMEVEAGTENEGVRLALYFARMAPDAKNTFDLIADPALARVVQVAAGLPESVGALDVDKQAAMIEWRLDLADLKEPAKLGRLLERFTALWDVEASRAAPALEGPSVLLGDYEPAGPDMGALLALQSWRSAH